MHPEPWWLLIPFALICFPPLGAVMVLAAIWRNAGGIGGMRDSYLSYRDTRRPFTPPAWRIVHEEANK